MQNLLLGCSKWFCDWAVNITSHWSNHRWAISHAIQPPTDSRNQREASEAPQGQRGRGPPKASRIFCLCRRTCRLLYRRPTRKRRSRSSYRVWMYWEYDCKSTAKTVLYVIYIDLLDCTPVTFLKFVKIVLILIYEVDVIHVLFMLIFWHLF